jgi:hypothetical protein
MLMTIFLAERRIVVNYYICGLVKSMIFIDYHNKQ